MVCNASFRLSTADSISSSTILYEPTFSQYSILGLRWLVCQVNVLWNSRDDHYELSIDSSQLRTMAEEVSQGQDGLVQWIDCSEQI